MAAGAAHEQQEAQGGWARAVKRFGTYFEEQGLGPANIPAAIVLHEVVGLVMAAGFWSLCYAAQPSKALARPLAGAVARSRRGAALQQAYNAAMAQATSTVQKLSWLRAAPAVDPARLTVALAESLMLRATIKPVTFPFKLWAAYKLTLLTKGATTATAGGEAAGGKEAGTARRRQ